MHEDKLNHDERLRLEALAQAVQLHAMGPKPSPEVIVREATTFAAFIRGTADE